MKKTAILILVLFGLIAIVSVRPAKSHIPDNNGLKITDMNGNVAGCALSGDECYWNVPDVADPEGD